MCCTVNNMLSLRSCNSKDYQLAQAQALEKAQGLDTRGNIPTYGEPTVLVLGRQIACAPHQLLPGGAGKHSYYL